VGETALHAKLSERMPTGVVYTTFHHPISGTNVLTTENSDWATNCPEYKVTAVQVGLARPLQQDNDNAEHEATQPAAADLVTVVD
jgi:formate dehydrogenase major subunit